MSGLTLDQYEDDEVSAEAIAKVTEVLDELVKDLRKGGLTQERFTYAWTQSGEPIEAQVSAQEALPALEDLRLFLHEAHEAGHEVVFSL